MVTPDKIALLEEEIKILKGEIKMILQDVRTALLARDNPFETDAFSFAAQAPSFAEPMAPEPQVARPPQVVVMPAPVAATEQEPEPIATTSTVPEAPTPLPTPISSLMSKARQEARPEPAARQEHNLSIQEMAVLMGWAQEAAGMLGRQDLDIVLSLARYGGLIGEELQTTLAELMQAIGLESVERRATVNDFLLTLRQLDAALSA